MIRQEIRHLYKILLDRAGSIQDHKSVINSSFTAFYPVQEDAMAVITFIIDQDEIRYLREEDAWL
jgi:hypothetical protein